MKESLYKLFFKAIGNKTRFKIVELLRKKGDKTVSQLQEELNLEQTLTSHSLKCLLNCGFVNQKREGKNIIYSLDNQIISILNNIDSHLKKYEFRLKSCGIIRPLKETIKIRA